MNRRHLLASALAVLTLAAMPLARAADEAPDVWIKRLSTDVLDTIKADKSLQSGNLPRIIALFSSIHSHINSGNQLSCRVHG